MREGLTAEHARAEALRRFGDHERHLDTCTREAREERPLVDGDRERIAAGRPDGSLPEVEQLLARHATPTSTSRKRAGAAPWETVISWPGSPLPQFDNPCSSQAGAEATASSEPQKRGVVPA